MAATHVFVLVWWESTGWQFSRATVERPGFTFLTERTLSGGLGCRRKDTAVAALRLRAAEVCGVSPECVAVLGFEEVRHG